MTLLAGSSACTTEDLEPSTEQNKPIEGGIISVSNLYGVLKGAYSMMTSSGYYGRDIIINGEVRGTDNCFSNGNSGRFTTEASLSYNPNSTYIWDNCYDVIASANVIIGTDATTLTGDMGEAEHYQGQAYVMRALAHYDLLRTYGQQHVGGTLGVPYVTEFKGEDLFPARESVSDNVTSIMADLDMGFSLMDDSYDDGSKQFISKFTAMAIKSRVAIYFGQWSVAATAAKAVIDSGDFSIVAASNFVSSWVGESAQNSIFELAFSATDNQGINGLAYIYRLGPNGSYGDVQVLDEVIDLYEDTDVRKDILGYEDDMLRNIGKYPNNQGYDNVPIIRYEEVVLNYAEALLETGDASGALTQLNLITSNRGATAYTVANKDNILNERRKELMFEGFRFDDLMRTGQDLVKTSLQQNILQTIPYGDSRLAYPIPRTEMDVNSNMEQNPGYGN
ncbi:RagB/SusD family nutrient uptake outer membrane protein [Robertkochia solimangrovi]|uniref:RagB/SusD family nutrient uptake outer membrane protein n=1 Tax=Robertkochia solimangrovi TaxID=2213046 RepID=UPI001F54C0CA|nr:RagB/SusD family nutrient uptake outer membrane protein [Robertkochia solimangrovi]